MMAFNAPSKPCVEAEMPHRQGIPEGSQLRLLEVAQGGMKNVRCGSTEAPVIAVATPFIAGKRKSFRRYLNSPLGVKPKQVAKLIHNVTDTQVTQLARSFGPWNSIRTSMASFEEIESNPLVGLAISCALKLATRQRPQR